MYKTLSLTTITRLGRMVFLVTYTIVLFKFIKVHSIFCIKFFFLSASGLLVALESFDFGRRAANISFS